MGTPASVVSEPPPWKAPTEARGRKKASANIFQDAELLQIQGLFQRSGDQLAEERAQIIWECAGDHRVAEALRKLRKKRPPRQKPLGHSVHHCSRLNFAKLCCSQKAETRPKLWSCFALNSFNSSPSPVFLFPFPSFLLMLAYHTFVPCRTPEPCIPLADPQGSATEMAPSDQYLNSRRASARIRQNWRKPGPTSYLHQIRH
ncbi:Arginine vasopressin-induced protein 1 [Galemys pyrenaicus]|uniref:Arginine vasopressin-induced protein 1 n=1 Tax=Galemys pyrenaicus TaxID=202257 RepID=A0A8J6ASA0_GALPY|nr:Arginine vasopressin-induced protein 1 [Galemys pyrenaicus]